MAYKFERLEVWQLALEYADLIYTIADQLPPFENFNLKSQITRAATSISLNIAEGSTSQSDAEQARFLGMAIRSLIETVACQHLINRRGYLKESELLRQAYRFSESSLSNYNPSVAPSPVTPVIKSMKNRPSMKLMTPSPFKPGLPFPVPGHPWTRLCLNKSASIINPGLRSPVPGHL